MIHQVTVAKITTKEGNEIAVSWDEGDQMVFIREDCLYFEGEAHHLDKWIAAHIREGNIIAYVSKTYDLEI